jgi:transcriptional regulator with XRE-family HTH domain
LGALVQTSILRPGDTWEVAGSTHSPRYREFRRRLRKAREEAGLSQREVARRLRRPPSFIAKVETGDRRLDVLELDEIASIYRRSVESFIPPKGK